MKTLPHRRFGVALSLLLAVLYWQISCLPGATGPAHPGLVSPARDMACASTTLTAWSCKRPQRSHTPSRGPGPVY